MSVPYATIVRKLMEQISLAEQKIENPRAFKQHISQVKLLCELILDEQTTQKLNEQMQTVEYVNKKRQESSEQEQTVVRDLPGDSIFDF